MNNSRREMICLDILRIFACFSVVAVHVAILFNIPGRIGQFMEAGSNGLGIFYILSGFLIFISLDNRKNSIGQWYIKRIIRILPMYYCVILIYIVVYEFIIGSVPGDSNGLKWLSYFLCINTTLPKTEVFWYNIGAVSSMSVFVWFYVLAPIIKRIVRNWNVSLIFMIISYGVLRLLQHTNVLQMFAAYYYFAIGIWIYYAIKESRERSTTIISLCIVAVLILADGKGGLLYGLVIGLIILNTYNLSISNDWLVRVIHFFSKRTFAIYLSHATVMQLADWLHVTRDIKGMLLFVIYSVIGVAILHELVENSVVRLYARLSGRGRNNDR